MDTTPWEAELAALLSELTAVQQELLDLLAQKRKHLAAADAAGIAALEPQEAGLLARLNECHAKRGQLLEQAGREGLPADSIQSLAKRLPGESGQKLSAQVRQAAGNARLVRHHALTNWVVVQRNLLHLSKILEIITTGGQLQPTYEKDGSRTETGSLLDHAV